METLDQWKARTGKSPTRAATNSRRETAAADRPAPTRELETAPPMEKITWAEHRARLRRQDEEHRRQCDEAAAQEAAYCAELAANGPGARTIRQRPETDASMPRPGESTIQAAIELRRLRTGETHAEAMDALGHVLACYAAGLSAPPPRTWSRDAIEREARAAALAAAAVDASAAADKATTAAKAAASAADNLRARIEESGPKATAVQTTSDDRATRTAARKAIIADLVRRTMAGEIQPGIASRMAPDRSTYYRDLAAARAAASEASPC